MIRGSQDGAVLNIYYQATGHLPSLLQLRLFVSGAKLFGGLHRLELVNGLHTNVGRIQPRGRIRILPPVALRLLPGKGLSRPV